MELESRSNLGSAAHTLDHGGKGTETLGFSVSHSLKTGPHLTFLMKPETLWLERCLDSKLLYVSHSL